MDAFQKSFSAYFDQFHSVVSSPDNDWTVKGFVDLCGNVYTISVDTKVVSKIIELMIFPAIKRFADEHDFWMELARHQNHYPDVTFIRGNERIALDIKSTYRVSNSRVNGMTLGAFTGYFRERQSTKNITFPYETYSKHYILGVIYSRSDFVRASQGLNRLGIQLNTQKQNDMVEKYLNSPTEEALDEVLSALGLPDIWAEPVKAELDASVIDERVKYSLRDNLAAIPSVVCDFHFFIQEKWKIATDRPGSGNTKNIGSVIGIEDLVNGRGIFTQYENGYQLFDDFWMNYLTSDMAQKQGIRPPYTNLESYFRHKGFLR